MENNNSLLENNHLQPNHISENRWSVRKWVSMAVVLAAVFALGYGAGQGRISVVNGQLQVNRAYDSQRADYSLFWDAYDLLNSEFVDKPLDQQKLLHGAISGMVGASGDPYTVFFDPKQAEEFANELQGTFDGIGAEIGNKDSQLVIVAPLDDSPAQRAGLMPGDIILGINDESTSGMTVDAAVSKIRGQAGTEVKLLILHPDTTDPMEITIQRARIEIKSVKLEMKEVEGNKYAVIKLSRFGDDTQGLLNHSVDVILQSGVKGIILDLRSNPGGYLETAVTTASNWVDSDKVVLRERGNDGSEKTYTSETWPKLKGIKTIVLVNGGSASASEIVAGALQDYGLATLVGEKTFGKGSVQELREMKDGSNIKITTAKWYTPNDRSIDKNGLEPDIKVEMTREDVQNNRDPQMDRAVEMLK
ncbi:MAG TPA: S41 family peptidase [Candidatus Binatia bacterium]|nr:S41 family peptidase [Candidatus Binatia bacterium]